MDYPLGAFVRVVESVYNSCLNPYSNGLPSRGQPRHVTKFSSYGLNPYSNGLPSRGAYRHKLRNGIGNVLIPILMDYPLGGSNNIYHIWKQKS